MRRSPLAALVLGAALTLAPTGTAGAEVTELTPPDPGSEVRAMIGWESLDNSLRWIGLQTIQGGEVTTAFRKAPDIATIPCTFNCEVPAGSTKPWRMWAAGAGRVA